MSWLKLSDDCFQYPKLLEALGYAPDDQRIRLELFGFIVALSTLSASHNTDYVISYGHIQTVGGARAGELTALCEKVGLLTKISSEPLQWMIHQDPEFIHMRLKNDVLWDRQQRNDNNNPALYGPVRLRDGDNCRWCGVAVVWRGPNKNARKGSLDHLEAGKAATVDTLVVSCLNCNASRGKSAYGPGERELLPPPKTPRYTQATMEDLAKIGIYVEQNLGYVPEVAAPAVCLEPSTASSGSQVDPAGCAAASECESSSQAIQPEEDPYFGVSLSKPYSGSVTESPAVRSSSQAIQPEEDPEATNLLPLVQPAPVVETISSSSTLRGVETPVNAMTETVETPPLSIEAPGARTPTPPVIRAADYPTVGEPAGEPPPSQVEVTAESPPSLSRVSQKSIDSLQTPALLSVDSPGRVGSGRDGSGLVGTGLAGTGQGGSHPSSCPGVVSLGVSGTGGAPAGGKRSRRRRK